VVGVGVRLAEFRENDTTFRSLLILWRWKQRLSPDYLTRRGVGVCPLLDTECLFGGGLKLVSVYGHTVFFSPFRIILPTTRKR